MSLDSLYKEIRNHPSNKWAEQLGYDPVYTASPEARIVIIGQAPGRKAQESKIPWNDASGDTLRAWLGMTRDEFYDETKIALTPMDFYYPGKGNHGDLPPRKDFALLWHPKIFAEMPHVQTTLLVGHYAQKYYLGSAIKSTLTETVRAYQSYLPKYIPLVHPSPLTLNWRRQNPWFEAEVIPEIRRIVQKCIVDN